MKKLSRLFGTVLLLLSCSTVAMGAPFLFQLPDPDLGGSRYAFTWRGVLEGIAADSPYYSKYNGEKFTLSGFYFSNGTFDFTRIDFIDLPEPSAGGGGSLVALPNPDLGGPGSLFLPPPDIGGPGSFISLIPRIEIDPPVPGSAPTARFLSLDFNGSATSPTISTYSYTAAPVPEPSTFLLFAAGLAGLTAIGRRKKAFFEHP